MQIKPERTSLDPADWQAFRHLAHRMVDDMLEGDQTLRDQPVWNLISDQAKLEIRIEPLPREPQGEDAAYQDFLAKVKPYRLGNAHPRFHGWAMGSGFPMATMADMLASDMDPNCGGGNQGSCFVELQVIDWLKEALGYDPAAGGILSSGGSMANLIGLNVARYARAGYDVRKLGLQGGPQLTFYGSSETHSWAIKAAELLGLGSDAFRSIAVDAQYRLDLNDLRRRVESDRAGGQRPFCVIATAGTINTGSIDDLDRVADFCAETGLWMHVDGAFGALAGISNSLKPLVAGMERADSIAFDLHKWMYLPFEIGCALVKDREAHRGAYASKAAYLAPSTRGFITEGLQFAETGFELSRGFKALKAWMCVKAYGMNHFARSIEANVGQARYLSDLVDRTDDLERMAPTALNIVAFRYRPASVAAGRLDTLNRELLMRLHERGLAVPSSTAIDGQFVMRACMCNHRTELRDMDALVADVLRLGQEILAES